MTTHGLQEATLLVLTALSRGSRHGYGIVTDVQQISGGATQSEIAETTRDLPHL